MVLTKIISETFGRYVAETAVKKFDKLEDALKHMFWWEEDFKVETDSEGNITSSGKCPVYRYYPKWCEEACLMFITMIAEKYGYTVKRTKSPPEYSLCEFTFRKIT